MNLKLKVLYNTAVQILGRFFTSIVTYLITLLLVRQYGPVGFGEFVKILTFVSYFYIMADFGFNAVVVKKITEDSQKTSVLISNLVGLRIAVSLFLIFVAISVLAFLPQGVDQGFTQVVRLGIIIGLLTILTQSLLTSTNAYFQKTLRYDKSVLAACLGYILTLCVAFVFAKNHLPVAFLIISYVLGGILSVLVSFLMLDEKILPMFNKKVWWMMLSSSWPLGLTLILNMVYFKADSFILTLTRSTKEVGVYGLAYKFFEMALVVPTFFMNSMYPVFLEKLKDKSFEFQRILKKSGLILFSASILITTVLFFASPFLINFTSGEKFQDFQGAIIALRILSLSLPFFFFSSFLMWILITHDRQKTMMFFYAVSMLLNIVLNIVLIPKYGYIAAAVTTGISEFFVMVLLLIPCWKYIIQKTI